MFNLQGDDSMSSLGFPSSSPDLRSPSKRAEDEFFVNIANVIASGQQFLADHPGRSQRLQALIRDIIQNLPINAAQLASYRDSILESLSAPREELSSDNDDNDNDGDHTPAPRQPSYVPSDYVPGDNQDTNLSAATPHSQGDQDGVPFPGPSDIVTAGESVISSGDGVDVRRASTPSARSPASDVEAAAAADEAESVESSNNVDPGVDSLDPLSSPPAGGEVTEQVGSTTSANVDAAGSPSVSETSAAPASALEPSTPTHSVPAPVNAAGAAPLDIALPPPAHAPRRLVRTYAFIAYKSSNGTPQRCGAPLQRENAIADISEPGLVATRRPEYFNAGGKRSRDEDDDNEDNDNDNPDSPKRHCAVMKKLGPSYRRDFDGRLWHVPAPSRSPSPTGKPQKKVSRRRAKAVASGSTPKPEPSQPTRPPRPFLAPKDNAKKRDTKAAKGKGKKRACDSDDEDLESPVAAPIIETHDESSPSKKLKRSHDSDVAAPLDHSQAESSTSSPQLSNTSESTLDHVAPPSTTEEPTAAASSGRVTRSSSSSSSVPRPAPSSPSRKQKSGNKKGKKSQSKATEKPPSPK